ncbi:acyltransferase family protein [Alphaproteobacteria bacterium]|nr:acyltransferase family protein [Alphaproteobacteria bacterium]
MRGEVRDNRIASLDSLRGLAALCVTIMHVYYIWGINKAYPSAAVAFEHFGNGVHLFFVISAFTLCLTYDNNLTNRVPLYFYIKRFFKISSLFYAMIAINFLQIKYFNKHPDIYSVTPVIFKNFLKGIGRHYKLRINSILHVF